MSAYFIVQINVKNQDNYKEYISQVSHIVEKFGGEYIVRGGKFEKMIGKWDYARTVVIKFPNYRIAMDFYNSDKYIIDLSTILFIKMSSISFSYCFNENLFELLL